MSIVMFQVTAGLQQIMQSADLIQGNDESIGKVTDFLLKRWELCKQKDGCHVYNILKYLNPLRTKRRMLYLKTQFVPHSKHFSSLL